MIMQQNDRMYLTLIVFIIILIIGFAIYPIITGVVLVVLILIFIGLPLIIGDLDE